MVVVVAGALVVVGVGAVVCALRTHAHASPPGADAIPALNQCVHPEGQVQHPRVS